MSDTVITAPFKIGDTLLDGTLAPAVKYGGATYSRNSVDGAGSGRNQKGKMIRDQIAIKSKWVLNFAPCTPAQLNKLYELTDPAQFSVTAPIGSGTYYCGNRSAPLLFYSREKDAWLFDGASIDIIEV